MSALPVQPVQAEPEDSLLPERVAVSEDDARRVLAQYAPTDPVVRKRVFSSLLRAMTAGGS
jgi:hypothetical protein